MKKEYKKPDIESILIDKEISLVLMTYDNVDEPPPPPGTAAAATANPFQENAFQGTLDDQ
ncbi:MAG: hypothetical protein GXO47_00010 [Chlorobi bacterium]|nr:hypothetical protein [Chlorobiota bacterium]